MSETNHDRIQAYLEELRTALAGSDPALAQDAVYDAEEFIHHALTEPAGAQEPEEERLLAILDRFGSPLEVAAAYRDTEARVSAAMAPPVRPRPTSPTGRILGVFSDPYTYGALLFNLLSLVTGIVSFTWVTTGVSLSLGLSVMIFGLPFFLLFLASVRALALTEGRIIEALLGERMPRRPYRANPEGSWLQRIKAWLADSRTWLTMLYLAIKMPLGVLSFSVFLFLLTFTISLFVAPFAQVFFDIPFVTLSDEVYYLQWWQMPFLWLGSAVLLVATLHLARLCGRWYAALGKAMLVQR